jgi:hypothetical protein
MKRNPLASWLKMGLLAAAAGAGCDAAQVQPPAHTSAQAIMSAESARYRTAPLPQQQLAPPAQDPRAVVAPVVNQPPPPAPAAVTIGYTPKADEAPAWPPVAEPVPPPSKAQASPRELAMNATNRPLFAHAEDYSWLCGQLQYSRFNKTWRLRYASVGEADPYGGSVTIVDAARVAEFKDGQYLRVQGRPVDPTSKSIAPPYDVDSIQVIAKE